MTKQELKQIVLDAKNNINIEIKTKFFIICAIWDYREKYCFYITDIKSKYTTILYNCVDAIQYLQNKYNYKYAIEFYNTMTDNKYYFVSYNKDNLIKYYYLCELAVNNNKYINELLELLKTFEINFIDDEWQHIYKEQFEIINTYKGRI